MRFLPDGTPVTTMSVAVNEGSGDKKHTSWWRVSVWRKAAEACNTYLTKGSRVLVVGAMQSDPETGGPRIWDGNDGKPRASFEITAREVKFLSSKGETHDAPQSDDDLPF
jgi:single-strand DNA-binding protein